MFKLMRKTTLQQKLTLFITLIVSATLLVFAVLFGIFSSDAIVKKASAFASRELSLMTSNLTTLVNNINNHAIMLSIDYRMQQLLKSNKTLPEEEAQKYNITKSMASIVTNIQGLNNNYISSSIILADGTVPDIGQYSVKNIAENIDEEALQKTARLREPVWSGPCSMQSKLGKRSDIFTVYKSIYDLDESTLLGFALLHVEEKAIGQMLRNLGATGVKNYIIDGDGIVVSGSDQADLYKSIPEASGIESLDVNALLQSSATIYGKSIVSMQGFEKLDMRILSVIPLSAITEESRILNSIIAISGILGFMLAFACAYAFSKSVIKPINNLIRTIEALPFEQFEFDDERKLKSSRKGPVADEFSDAINRVEEMTQRIYKEQQLKNDYKFKTMQAQIKPHFLYNALETIISLIYLNRTKDAVKYVKNLSDFYRISLSNGKDIITVGDEIALITNYLEIQKIRYAEFFDYSIQASPATLGYALPKLTLQPLVENSIYHGVKEKRQKGSIRVDVYKDAEDICLCVTDDGVGMTPEQVRALCSPGAQQHHPDSFGLENVLDRLRLIYGDGVSITADSVLNKYTNVTIKFTAEAGDV